MLKKMFIVFICICHCLLFGQTPAQTLEESLDVISISAIDTDVSLTHWRGYASVGTLSNQRPFCIQALVVDTQITIRLGFEMRCDSRLKPQWVWNEEKGCYLAQKDSEMTVYLFLTRDPLLDCVKGDCWAWHSSRSVLSGFADDLYYLKQHALDDQNQLDNRLLFSRENLFFDKGLRTWKNRFYAQKTAPHMQRYYTQTPTQSAGDVHVKTIQNGLFLTLEFSRALHTPYRDDLLIVRDEHLALQVMIEQDGKMVSFSPVINIWQEETFDPLQTTLEQDLDLEVIQ